MEFRASWVQSNPVWNLDRIDQANNNLDRRYGYRYNGTGISVYILASGIRTTHTDFEGRASFLFSAFGNGEDSQDCNGHGTHVAGIVGSHSYGVSKKVHLYNVQVLDCDGIGSSTTLLAGMNSVAQNYKAPAILSLSLGGPPSNMIDSAATTLINSKGVMLIVAAGNENTDACQWSPARVSGVITVAATDFTDTRSTYSNYGSCVDLFAPGDNIRSLSSTSDVGSVVYSGTSMAAPHVSGVVAQWLSYNRRLTPQNFYSLIAVNSTANVVLDVGLNSPNLLVFMPFNEGYDPPLSASNMVTFLTDNWVPFFVTAVVLIILVGVWHMFRSKKQFAANSWYRVFNDSSSSSSHSARTHTEKNNNHNNGLGLDYREMPNSPNFTTQ